MYLCWFWELQQIQRERFLVAWSNVLAAVKVGPNAGAQARERSERHPAAPALGDYALFKRLPSHAIR
jgi:hypothetical protein